MSNIKCRVEECIYNDHENCEADEIMVRSSHSNHPESPDQTACETFVYQSDK